VYDYASIANGDYQTLPFARKPLLMSVDGVNFSKPTRSVTNPSRATVAEAVSAIKSSQRIPPGTRTFGSALALLSEEDLLIRTGGSGYFLGFGGSHQFDYQSNKKSHKYFLDVVQSYYTVSVDDSVHEPGDLFVTKKEQPGNAKAVDESKIDPDWVFVESVTYGRMLQVMIESDQSLESVGFNVEAYANILAAGGQGDFSMDQRSLLEKTTVTVAAIGGRADSAGKLANSTFANLRGRIDDYFDGTDDEVPIAYSLRTLDGALVGTHMTTEFTSRQCAPLASHYKVSWKDVICLQSDDQNSRNDAEETKVFVRIRAWDGAGKEILDVGKRNEGILATEKVNKQSGTNIVPIPWTFMKGSGDQPLVLSTGERRDMSTNSLKFAVSPGDKSAKIGIRADVLEFDGFADSNDDFADEGKSYLISEIGSGKAVSLLCTHEDSRIQFNFTIEPVFED
ncbi:MAG: thiol-activated cytolysin family protein, partial [Acidobacteriota bacterium]|nr:thiol-activated cytolysin family protein [Acidobacteriota bacterium]